MGYVEDLLEVIPCEFVCIIDEEPATYNLCAVRDWTGSCAHLAQQQYAAMIMKIYIVVYLMVLSVTQTIVLNDWLMASNILGRVWKEMVMD